MSYPRDYPTGIGDGHLDENDWNAMVDRINGFSASGTFKSPYKYVIVEDGTDTYAANAFQVVYGGPSDEGGVDGADTLAVIQAAIDNLTAARDYKEKVVAVGDFTIDSSIILPSYTVFELIGKIALDDAATTPAELGVNPGVPAVCNENWDQAGGLDHDIDVIGGEYWCNQANMVYGHTGISLRGIYNCTIARTYVHNCNGYAAIYMAGNGGATPVRGNIHHNLVDDVIGEGLWGAGIGVTALVCNDTLISNNILNNCRNGILVEDYAEYITVDHNVVTNPTQNGIVAAIANYLDINHNTVRNIAVGGYRGIAVDTANHVKIDNNTIHNSQWESIYVINATDGQVTNNRCFESNLSGQVPLQAILLKYAVGSAYRFVVANNHCRDSGATAHYGIYLDTGCDYINLKNNICSGFATAPYYLTGTHNQYDGKIQMETPADLSGAASTHILLHTEQGLYLATAQFLYTEASSADAGVTLNIGKESLGNYYYTGTSEGSKAQYYTLDLTLLAHDIAAGDTVLFSNAGGKTGTGEVAVTLDYLVF